MLSLLALVGFLIAIPIAGWLLFILIQKLPY